MRNSDRASAAALARRFVARRGAGAILGDALTTTARAQGHATKAAAMLRSSWSPSLTSLNARGCGRLSSCSILASRDRPASREGRCGLTCHCGGCVLSQAARLREVDRGACAIRATRAFPLPTRQIPGPTVAGQTVGRSRQYQRTLVLALLLATIPCAPAQSGGGYVMRKQVLAPGGRAEAAVLRVSSTLAEPGAGVLAGGNFRLTAGFQTPRLAPAPDLLLVDGFE